MKRVIRMICLLLVMAALTACQATPEKEVIIGKENAEENIIQSTASVSAATYNFPDRWKDTLSFYDGKLMINIDAALDVPDVGIWPVYSVELMNYTQEEVDAITTALFGGATLYSASHRTTKAEYEEMIINCRLAIEQIKNGTYNGDDNLEGLEDQLKLLEELMQAAPETWDDNQVVTSEMYYDSGMDSDFLYVKADLGQDEMATLDVRSGLNLPNSENAVRFLNTDTGSYYDAFYRFQPPIQGVELTFYAARAAAEQLLSNMGIEGYAFAAMKIGSTGLPMEGETNETIANETEQCYLLYYTKVYNGLPSTYEDVELPGGTIIDKDAYSPPVFYDRITIAINDEGILSFVWLGRETQTGVLNENATLLPFEDIQEVFMQIMKVKYAYVDENNTEDNTELKITAIKLGYIRIQRADYPGQYMAIPVWDFYGYSVNEEERFQGTSRGPSDYSSLLTISAIDGSVIDRELGY